MSTLDYYNSNAEEFVSGSKDLDMEALYSHFLPRLKPGASILDLGCGSGRDSRNFLDLGYDVTSVDGSEALCALAKETLDIDVRCLSFEKLDYSDRFDAVWACASLLHVPKSKMRPVLEKVCRALKPGGIAYMSFKYGTGERNDSGKHYSDYTEINIGDIFEGTGLSEPIYWISSDSLGRETRWLNIIVKKL